MFKDTIEKIKQIIKENFKLFIVFFVLLILFTYQFPYYIEVPGGTIDISSRVEVENGYNSTGSFHMAYVGEMKATFPTLVVAKFKKDWDVIPKKDAIPENENEDDVYFRDHLLLGEANQNAIIVAFEKAGKKIEYKKTDLYITYIDKRAQTNLKVGDRILQVNGIDVFSKDEVSNLLEPYDIGENIPFTIIRDNKQMNVEAKMVDYDETHKAVGIMVTEKQEIETNPAITFHFKSSESGSSGGLMMTLAIYNQLVKEDITNGKKIVGTGTIDKDGNVGSIAGIKYKLKGAVKEKADLFFVPNGENYEEAIELKEKNNYNIEIIGVSTFDEALFYLENM